MASNLVQRIAVSAVLIPLAFIIILRGGWVLAGALALFGVLGASEVYDLARRQGIEALTGVGYAAAAAIPLATYWAKGSEDHWAEPAIFAGALWLLVVLTVAMVRRGPGGKPLTSVAVTVFGALYASALLSFIIPIRHPANSLGLNWHYAWLVLLPLAVTWICDTCAMAAGRIFGGPKLAPVLSPKKTWAGAIGGVVGGVAGSILIGLLILATVGWRLSVAELALVGVVVSLTAQVGDVAESLFKREAGVKDSSQLIPGHGGVLDRLDSLYFVVPVSAGLFRLMGLI
ncbi:MAG TPA: CDP-archaeol synthase [Gemmatimonadales bacterium]|nr:CDP-archaeol synthase [Gemmatimonadales bacterium]